MKAKDIRGRVISTRFTDAEHKRVAGLAAAEELTPAEWLHDLALKVTTPDRRFEIMTEELLALRLIVQAMVAHLAGHQLITEDMLRNACANADRVKKDRARALFGLEGRSVSPRREEVTTNVQ
jgi:hypothetical protein